MIQGTVRQLKVFLCHASGDKPQVRELYKRLIFEGVDAWLDREKLLPGQDWRLEIPRAVHEADVVLVCLSKKSITKEGYIQKEIKFALDIADEKPEGTIFLIPARLEDCTVPERLSRWHWVDLFDEDGFIKLMRSLKLRSDAVGAVIEPASYEDTDKDREQRIKRIYTDGLAAFYTEDWDKACHCFQSILSEQPNHKNAAEKLEEAQRQRILANLYARALEAVKNEDWQAAIQTLEELSQKSVNYKDAAQLLKNVRRQEQLRGLYAEAKALHEAQKWEAVVRVFDQIARIDPKYEDAEGILSSAQEKIAELQRLDELNDLYGSAVGKMDAGHWDEARQLLEKVHKSQTGFLETEKLLKKVEEEIAREEEKRRQNDQVNTLYEQAHGLLRSKKWRNALEKMGEIRKLDERFPDMDGIFEKVHKELAREEQETERQNKLSALYAEAVKLLKEEKFQEALEKWQEVRVVDPKYPDRQRVHNTARKALTKQAKPIAAKPMFVMTKTMWIGLGGVIAIAVLVFAINQFGNVEKKTFLAPTTVSIDMVVENTAPLASTATNLPPKTSTPLPVTAIPTTDGYSDPTIYDDFDNSAYEGRLNPSLWSIIGGESINFSIRQIDGQVTIKVEANKNVGFFTPESEVITKSSFFEMRAFLDPATTEVESHLYMVIGTDQGHTNCGVFGHGNLQDIRCWSVYYGKKVEPPIGLDGLSPGWHMYRFEIEPTTMVITYMIDGNKVAAFDPREEIPNHFSDFQKSKFTFQIGLNNTGPSKAPVGYIDYIRMGAIEDDPTVYDSFNNISFDGSFNPNLWWYDPDAHSLETESVQQDGLLFITQSGIDQSSLFTLKDYWGKRFSSNTFIEASFKIEMSSDGDVSLSLLEDGQCGLHTTSNKVDAYCIAKETYGSVQVLHSSWNTLRIEINVDENIIRFFVNNVQLAENWISGSLRTKVLYPCIGISSGKNRVENTRPVIAFVNNVRVGPLEYVNP